MYGFCVRWRGWIKQCIYTARVSVLVNGSPTEEFSMEKGLCQGDFLSPFLFNMAAEDLSGMLKISCDLRLIEGIDLGQSQLSILHLQYADDTLIFSSDKLSSLQNIKRILQCFELVSGLKVNLLKSSITRTGIEEVVVANTASNLRCIVTGQPLKYLGLPIGAVSSRTSKWHPAISRISFKLSSRKGKRLSIGGRICLIKLVLNNLPIYFLSLFPVPITIAAKIERKRRSF